ncbi:cytochrome P450 [Gorgonomyces haynaldii]|nr:cytochrome P450 [Gorgonomyces haynaldii]
MWWILVLVLTVVLWRGKRITAGPKAVPWIGNLFDLLDNPIQKFQDWFNTFGDTFQLLFFGQTVLATRDPDLIHLALTSPDFGRTSAFQETLKDSIPFALFALPSGDVWKRHRKMLSPAFGPPQLRLFQKIVLELCHDLVDKIKEKQVIDMTQASTCIALDAIASVGGLGDFKSLEKWHLGQENNTSQMLMFLNRAVDTRFQMPAFLWPFFTEGYKSKRIQEIMNKFESQLEPALLQEKSPEGNIIQCILGQDLTKQELKSEVIGLFIAGQDTSSSALQFLIMNLCQNPEIQEQLAQKVQNMTPEVMMSDPFVDQVVHESMRLNPTVPMMSRATTRDLQFKGMLIPKGTTVYLSLIELHKHKEIYSNPDTFDPSRSFEPKAYFPFGAGPHMCIGYKMALMEVKLVVCHLVKHFRFEMQSKSKMVHAIISKLEDPLLLLCHKR